MSFALALHGGAGVISRVDLSASNEAAIIAGLRAALDAGVRVLATGGSALDAVEAAVVSLEDNPLFNAGRGAVFNAHGLHELEAAIMDGTTRAAGAVTGLRRAMNPIRVARRVMTATDHVMLGFDAADRFALEHGLATDDAAYFFTQARWDALQAELARLHAGGDREAATEQVKHGTVGAVALDTRGRLAAATSTGGRTAKMPGRIGDTAILGAGTWADDLVAVSSTGHGESFMRCAAAHEVACRMRFTGQPLEDAVAEVVHGALPEIGGSGGMIAIDWDGSVTMQCNTEGMYRAAIDTLGHRVVAIYA